jgi:hypothetical protein
MLQINIYLLSALLFADRNALQLRSSFEAGGKLVALKKILY